ncbi:MAG: hypothetical protein HUJ52_01750 [Malacoplasma sp.]|nr:hypothetical protein [Malacoplasma sp.]
MKKTKLITSLMSLGGGALAIATPIVATSCSCSGDSNKKEISPTAGDNCVVSDNTVTIKNITKDATLSLAISEVESPTFEVKEDSTNFSIDGNVLTIKANTLADRSKTSTCTITSSDGKDLVLTIKAADLGDVTAVASTAGFGGFASGDMILNHEQVSQGLRIGDNIKLTVSGSDSPTLVKIAKTGGSDLVENTDYEKTISGKDATITIKKPSSFVFNTEYTISLTCGSEIKTFGFKQSEVTITAVIPDGETFGYHQPGDFENGYTIGGLDESKTEKLKLTVSSNGSIPNPPSMPTISNISGTKTLILSNEYTVSFSGNDITLSFKSAAATKIGIDAQRWVITVNLNGSKVATFAFDVEAW